MDGKKYQELAMRTNDGNSTRRIKNAIHRSEFEHGDLGTDVGGVFNACLGLSGEVGETLDMIKKWIFHERLLDLDHLEREIGDIMWYIALMCESFGFDMSNIMSKNINKLMARYPEGFDVDRANLRAKNDL